MVFILQIVNVYPAEPVKRDECQGWECIVIGLCVWIGEACRGGVPIDVQVLFDPFADPLSCWGEFHEDFKWYLVRICSIWSGHLFITEHYKKCPDNPLITAKKCIKQSLVSNLKLMIIMYTPLFIFFSRPDCGLKIIN